MFLIIMPFVCDVEMKLHFYLTLSSVFHWITDGFFPDKIYVRHEKNHSADRFWDYGYHIDDFQNKKYYVSQSKQNKHYVGL